MLTGCHDLKAKGIPFDSICYGDPGRKTHLNNVSQGASGIRVPCWPAEVILLPCMDVDIACSLVWMASYNQSLCFIVSDEFLNGKAQMRSLHAYVYIYNIIFIYVTLYIYIYIQEVLISIYAYINMLNWYIYASVCICWLKNRHASKLVKIKHTLKG